VSAPQRPGPPSWPNQQQPYGQPGQTEYIPRVTEPRRDEPFQFEEPRPEPPPNPVATWALRVAGLVAVAVLSGVAWAYLQDDDPQNPPAADGGEQVVDVPAGRFTFTPHEDMPEPRRDTDCAANSRDKVREFFESTPCAGLVRALYTSTPPGQDKLIYTWVAVVRMPTPEAAAELHKLAETPNTGNVTDPFIAGIVTAEGVGRYGLGGGGYESQLSGSSLIIVESDWMPSAKRTEEQDAFLTEVSADAIRYGQQFATQG
jgi:hypothetical protein